MSNEKSLLSILPLFLVLFIDGMGLGLLFPILNALIIDPNAGFFPRELSIGMRDFYYGLTIGIFMICWFFGAAMLGDLSDSVGRKKSLMICLIGAFLGYLLCALAVEWQSFAALIIGRVIAGFTAGSQPIAQAAIVDVSSDANKARNIGLILLAVSLGFVFGPVFGGLLSDPRLISWFNFSTPLYFAALISLLNALLLYFFFQETFSKAKEKIVIRWDHAIQVFKSAFTHPTIKHYSVVMLVMIFGWSNYFSFVPLYLLQVYHYSAMQNSLFLAVLGLGFSIGCAFVVDWCTLRFKLTNVVIVGLVLTSLNVLLILVRRYEWLAWVATFNVGISLSVAYSVLLAIFSNQVSKDEQGWVMGVTGSISALCFGITSLFTGIIAQVGATLPILLAFAGLSLSALVLFFVKPTPQKVK